MKLIHTVREHHAERAAYRRLRRELSAYRTPSDIDDLMAAVDREGGAPEVQEILHQNLRAYHRRSA